MEEITFYSEGVACKGDLFVPDGCDDGNPRPAIVVGHGFSGVKEVLQFHGQYFCDAGYVTLTIDYRTFGRSEGEPRGRLFPQWQVEDYKNAITWLQQRDDVMADQIGIWGTSFGGGIVIRVRRGGIVQDQAVRVRCLFMHRNAHVIDHVDNIFDLLGIDDVIRQVIVDLGIGQETLLLTLGDELFQLGLLIFVHKTLRLIKL